MTTHKPSPDDDSHIDATFQDIVARWDGAPKAPKASTENPVADQIDRTEQPPTSGPCAAQWDNPASKSGSNSARSYSLHEPEPEHFVPQEAPPLRMPHWKAWISWIPVLLAPIFFVGCALFWQSVPKFYIGVASAMFVAGAAMLIMNLRSEPRDPDDDGAVL